MDSKQLTGLFWDEHYRGKDRARLSKIKQKIWDWLNLDNFGGFVLDNDKFWIEKTCSTSKLPNYVLAYLKKWASKKGFTSIYTA